MKISKQHRERRGLALVVVLWIVALLAVVVAVTGKNTRLDTHVCMAAAERVRGRWALKAGLERATALLNDDTNSCDSAGDVWDTDEEEAFELDGCVFGLEISDEAGKLNVNTVTKEQLMALPRMTEDVAESIIDWRDKDNNASVQGAEGSYYQSLEYGYPIRNAPLRTIRELLLVKGVTPEVLYGDRVREGRGEDVEYAEESREGAKRAKMREEDKGLIAYLTCYSYDNDRDALGSERVNINKADENKLTSDLGISKSHAKWIVEKRRNKLGSIADLIDKNSPKKKSKKKKDDDDEAEAIDLETFKEIADQITVRESGHIAGLVNINTASIDVIAALLKGDEELAQAVVAHCRASSGLDSIGDLLDVKGMKIDTFKNIANNVTVRSCVFRVQCRAASTTTKAKYYLDAVVDRGSQTNKVLYCYQGADR